MRCQSASGPRRCNPFARSRYAESRPACEKERDQLLLRFKKTDPRACASLNREREVAFFDYLREHWIHLRTTNIVESPFDRMRPRTDAARRFKSGRGDDSRSCCGLPNNPGARSPRRI